MNSFSARMLHRIKCCHWLDFLSNQWLYLEAGMHPVTCMIQEHQLRLFGHITQFSEFDPVIHVLFDEDLTKVMARVG